MTKTPRLIFLVLLLTAPLATAGYGDGDPRLHRLFATFMSPCCWTENLTQHDSPAAVRLRTRIGEMVQSGRSDSEIESALIREYGKRILALPEGAERRWLFWVPPAVGVAGLALVLAFLRRSMKEPPLTAMDVTPADREENWDDFS
jgi:cytochrome c-type biogenesis protein CcmH/NrfF